MGRPSGRGPAGAGATDRHRPARLDSLTSLRYLAALLVLLYHMADRFWRPGLLSTACANGFVGVSFFFVLSGFVLTWSRRSRTSARTFYLHRFARIWPLHFATLVVMWVVLATQRVYPGVGPTLANALLIHDWIPLPRYYISVNNPSWTLSCELVFYLMFPFLIPRLQGVSSRRLWWLSAALGVVVVGGGLAIYGGGQLVGRANAAVLLGHFYPPIRVGQFVLGITLALLIERGWRCPVGVWPSLAIAATPFVLAALLSHRRGGALVVMDAVTLPGFWLVIASVVSAQLKGRPLRPLTNRASVALGQWSFALYLLQFPLLTALADLGVHPRMDIADVLAGSVALTLISGAVFLVFERPVERVLRRRLTPGSLPSVSSAQA